MNFSNKIVVRPDLARPSPIYRPPWKVDNELFQTKSGQFCHPSLHSCHPFACRLVILSAAEGSALSEAQWSAKAHWAIGEYVRSTPGESAQTYARDQAALAFRCASLRADSSAALRMTMWFPFSLVKIHYRPATGADQSAMAALNRALQSWIPCIPTLTKGKFPWH